MKRLSILYAEYYYSLCLTRLWIEALKDQCRCPFEFVELIKTEAEELRRDLARSGVTN